MPQAAQQRVHVQPRLGQPVFVTDRTLLVRHFFQDVVRHQLLQPVCQDVTCDAEPLLERIKATYLQKTVAQNQQRPPIANHGNRAGHRTSLLVQVLPAHG